MKMVFPASQELLENPILHIKNWPLSYSFSALFVDEHYIPHIDNLALGKDLVFRTWEKI